jgi:hypothetical protein
MQIRNDMSKNKYNLFTRSKLGFASLSAAVIGLSGVANAGDVTWDFNSDPVDEGIILSGNNDAIWVEEGGNDGGFLAVTYPEGGQDGYVAFPSIDPEGKIVAGFKLEGQARIGNSTGDRAADGFSVSMARDNGTDPVVEELNSNGAISGMGSFAGGIAEAGTTTGVAVSFDTWAGNTLPDGGDIEGIIVRVDNVTVTREGLPTRHGECDDITSLQTGPRNQQYWDDGGDPRDPESWADLCWQPFSVEVTAPSGGELAKLTVSFKGNNVLDNFELDYFPTKSRVILAGRTGGANEHTHFDNLHLTTEVIDAGGLEPAPSNLKVDLEGAGFVRLSWDAAPTQNLVAYKVERDGTQLAGQVTGTTFDDFGVSPNSSYKYKVYTMNIAGDLSEESTNEVTATTIDVVEVEAFQNMLVYEGIGGTDTPTLIFDTPDFPDNPTRTVFINGLDFTPGGIADNYGGFVTGTLTPPVSGDYHFFIRSDDASEFFLNDGGADIPDPTSDFPIAFETGCCNAFQEPGAGDQTTVTPISLSAGEKYGFAMVVKEGGGGDWFQVAWRLEGDDTPAADLQPITGAAVGGGLGDPTGAWINITSQPQDAVVPAGSSATIGIGVDAGSPYTSTVLYQWMKDGQAIPGATNQNLVLNNATDADSGEYSVKIIVLGLSETSESATISVQEPAALVAGNSIGINFASDEPAGNGSAVDGEAGVIGTSVWNNLVGGSGASDFLIADVDGSAGLTGVKVTWSSPNTWSSQGRGEENNSAPEGNDRNLMTGYIDTNGTDPNQVIVTGLPSDLSYDVVVYMKGGVVGRGGDYTVKGSLANGLVARWNFDNEDFSDSVGSYNGEGMGTDPIAFGDGPTAEFGKALTLDGIDQFVEITSDGGDLGFTGGSMSVSTWFRANDFDKSWQALIADGEGNRWRLHRRGGEGGFAWVGGNGDTPVGADVSIGEWHHVVGVADASGLEFGSRLYLDGEIYATNDTPADLGTNDFNVMIGENPDARGRTWNGDIDDVAMWNRVLTQDEVKALGAGPLQTGGVTLPHYDSGAFTGNFVHGRDGDYIVFKDISGTSFVLEGQPVELRAPINGIDILIGGGFEPPAGGGGGGISSVALADGNVVIEYTGTLKSADSVTGPYSDVAGASSPYSVAPTKAAEFYIAE